MIAFQVINTPYLIPMNFGCKDQKYSFIRVQIKTRLEKNEIAYNWGMGYMSVIGEGNAYFKRITIRKLKLSIL